MIEKSFLNERNAVIEDFAVDCIACGLFSEEEDFSHKQFTEILNRFCKHEKCYKHKEEFDKENLDIFVSGIYGDNESASIDCMHCNSVIIDSNVLKEI